MSGRYPDLAWQQFRIGSFQLLSFLICIDFSIQASIAFTEVKSVPITFTPKFYKSYIGYLSGSVLLGIFELLIAALCKDNQLRLIIGDAMAGSLIASSNMASSVALRVSDVMTLS